ncbi:hypothetical protein GR248_24255 [Rhizobium leguminosarum]|uniref:hypothetical protein n=1 Tax=Rhizobium leguminosarum TaxID=384 RepID=UPI0013C9E934|nr:hypothetical protein [Rhizobium leguminosarum]NEI93915.1 hypothetical protein [Rhizobium leguminosarum]
MPKPSSKVKTASKRKRSAPQPSPDVPPPAEEKDIVVRRGHLYGPQNIRFGKISGPGMVNYGAVTIGDFFKQDPDAFPNVPASLQRVIQAVSENEGRIEAINTYDNSFMSCGVFQWTAGAKGYAGELAGLLGLLSTDSPKSFEEYFGSVGIDVVLNKHDTDELAYGYLKLNGKQLDSAKAKAVLRKHIWAYRFWRAAHDKEVRRAQILLAMQRVGTFYAKPVMHRRGLTVGDYITSEFGVALLLDEHVNRPGHVPRTLLKGVDQYSKKTGRADPSVWTDADERAVLVLYLAERAKTSMTNSKQRAAATRRHVKSGELSDRRDSFRV